MTSLARLSPIALVVALLAACGGGGSSSSGSAAAGTTSSPAAAEVFPTGMAVASPTDLATQASVTTVSAIPLRQRFADAARTLREAIASRDLGKLGALATWAAPLSSAHAAPVMTPEFFRHAAVLQAILNGTVNPSTFLRWNEFLQTSTNDNCYGPQVLYQNHDDGADGAPLPTGDVGLWLASASDGKPCAVAQLGKRMRGVRAKANQGLILMATMIDAANDAHIALPSAGASISLTSQMNAIIQADNPSATVSIAELSQGLGGTDWTYRVRATDASANVTVEVLLQHTPGATTSLYSGVLSYIVESLSSDGAFGCTDETSGGSYKVATVGTVRYSKTLASVRFGAREAQYCGHGTSATRLAADVASFDSNGELDPSVKLAGNVRGGTKGWRGNFNRFGAQASPLTLAGNFLYAWQAGTGDSHSRMFAVTKDYNSVTEVRTAKAFFGYANPIDTTTGAMLGMICNWAGPGGTHSPNDNFQYQQVSLGSAGSAWTIDSSLITYAPTNTCASSGTMRFDVNADGSLGATEGNSVANGLDSKGASASVAAELTARGFSVPASF